MKATGIIRRIDDLGRVVIPKEIRRIMKVREEDPLEIFIEKDGSVIIKKYSPIAELGDFAKEYADSLYEATGHVILIADTDSIIAVAGASKRDWLNKEISVIVKSAMEGRTVKLLNDAVPINDYNEVHRMGNTVISPVISEGDCIGAVIITTKEEGVLMGDMEMKLCETASGFLGKQFRS